MLVFITSIMLAQVVVGAIVVFILLKVLDKILIDTAIKKIEILKADSVDQSLKDIGVVTFGPLSEAVQQRILDALFKKLQRTTRLVITQDKTLKAGIIIKLNTVVIDYSLMGRLREGGVIG